jgi:hypothetical protein
MNNFQIKNKIRNMNNFQILKNEQFSKMNIFYIWTFFIYEQIRNMNNFQI